MKSVLLIIAVLVGSINGFSQNQKGLSAIENKSTESTGKTYALIVGISKYKNPSIPPLQYADKDAMAFYEYLRNTDVDSNNIILLLNEKASNGDFWANIIYLMDLAKPGDKVFIYFSGHGDVENKTVVKDAYLLPYDAPKCAYVAGAIPVLQLKSWIATWSANNIQVVFIADACRSGNLAGGREGMEAAASILKEKWKDEVKILSCQPGELSLEGKQWGNGRGLFSYYLINGLYGLADNDKDGKVTLRELNMYLMGKVAEEAKPQDQDPMLFGTMGTVLADVNKKQLALLNNQKETPSFASVETRGFDDGLMKGLDDSLKLNYKLFKTYLDSGILLRMLPAPSAYKYFITIPDNPTTHSLRALMTRNYSAALMRDIDGSFNFISQNRLEALGRSGGAQIAYEGQILRKILGDDILKRQTFLAKAMFWDAMRYFLTNTLTKEEAIKKFDSCLILEPNSSYAYISRGILYRNNKQCDKAIKDIEKAITLTPKLTYAYDEIKDCYIEQNKTKEAIHLFHKLSQYDTLCELKSYELLAYVYHKTGKEDSSQVYNNRLLSFLSTIKDQDFVRLGISVEIGDIFYALKKYKESIHYYKLFYEENKLDIDGMQYNIACCYSLLDNKEEALRYLEMALNNHYEDYYHILEDTDLNNIRQAPQFNTILRKHFPDKHKDGK